MIDRWIERRRIRKAIKWRKEQCAQGKHVPVRMVAFKDKYLCQECATTLTREDYEKYWTFREYRYSEMEEKGDEDAK